MSEEEKPSHDIIHGRHLKAYLELCRDIRKPLNKYRKRKIPSSVILEIMALLGDLLIEEKKGLERLEDLLRHARRRKAVGRNRGVKDES